MKEFTPGPWGYFCHHPEQTWHIGDNPRSYVKGQFCIASVDTEANARLIAHAPEMYSYIESIRNADNLNDRQREAIDNLLSKAAGGS